MPEAGERRKRRRLRFETRIDLVYKGVTSFASVRSANLSAGGAFVVMSQPPPPGTLVIFGLMVGNYGHHHGEAEVVWARPAERATEHPAGFGMRFLSFAEGSAELIGRFVDESFAAGEGPTGHDGEPAVAIAEATVVTPLPMPAVAAAASTVITPLPIPAPPEPVTPVGAPRLAPAAASVAEAAAAEQAPPAAAPAETPLESFPPAAPVAAEAGVTAAMPMPLSGEVFAVEEARHPEPESRPSDAESAPVFDLSGATTEERQPAAAQLGAPAPAEPEAPAPAATEVAARAEPEAPVSAEPEVSAPAEPEAPALAKPEVFAPAEPQAPAPAKPEAPTGVKPEARARVPVRPPAAARAKAVASPEVEAPAPAKRVRPPRPAPRPPRRWVVVLGVIAALCGGLYFGATQTAWGRAQARRLGVLGLLASSATTAQSGSAPSAAPGESASAVGTPAPADRVERVAWTSTGQQTVITVTTNGPLALDRVVTEELAKPPRSLVRVRGIIRPCAAFQEKTGLPNVASVRALHRPELVPPELDLVVEPSGEAKVTGVRVDGRRVVIEVSAAAPAQKAKRR